MVGNNHRGSPEVTLKNSNASSPTPNMSVKMGTSHSLTTNNNKKPSGAAGKRPSHRAPLRAAKHLKKLSPLRHGTLLLLDSRWFMVLKLVVTIYALFGDDVRTSLFIVTADNTFFSLTTICFVADRTLDLVATDHSSESTWKRHLCLLSFKKCMLVLFIVFSTTLILNSPFTSSS